MSDYEELPEEFQMLEDSLRMDDIEQKLVELELGIFLVHYRLDMILRSAGIEPAPMPED